MCSMVPFPTVTAAITRGILPVRFRISTLHIASIPRLPCSVTNEGLALTIGCSVLANEGCAVQLELACDGSATWSGEPSPSICWAFVQRALRMEWRVVCVNVALFKASDWCW
jgi:hypothetical protein